MISLRLFHKTDPAHAIEVRTLGQGEFAIGRDLAADWAIPDPSKTLSRRHCVIIVGEDAVAVRDDSTNGVFRADGARLAPGVVTPLAWGEAISLGAFVIRLDPPAQAAVASQPKGAPPTTLPLLGEGSPAGRLLDAFCGGAQIDSSVLSGEDPTEVMRRLGGIYRQMVVGLGALMDERTRAKARYGLEWTTVQALDNNPFRWAPPQRIVVDLLQTRQDGFLSGEEAVKSSFDDLQDHQQRLMAGSRAAIDQVLDDLAPEAVSQRLKTQPFRNSKKAEALWAEYAEAHAEVREGVDGSASGSAAEAFRQAYTRTPQGEDTPGTDPPGEQAPAPAQLG